MAETPKSGIEVTLEFDLNALWCGRPRVVLEEQVRVVPWGSHLLELPPGKYVLSVYAPLFPLSFGSTEDSLTATVYLGEITKFRYRVQWAWYRYTGPGSLRQTSPKYNIERPNNALVDTAE
jgi:hypothetical protein